MVQFSGQVVKKSVYLFLFTRENNLFTRENNLLFF